MNSLCRRNRPWFVYNSTSVASPDPIGDKSRVKKSMRSSANGRAVLQSSRTNIVLVSENRERLPLILFALPLTAQPVNSLIPPSSLAVR
ncbi:hypothetical protein CDAR_172561 [Caerostris darwini]|uniref:Uncharacterized protein n=1 Tax=Caerostris darwini TaxID=1538125 RepID=A0AAV4MEB4_9ARAC|nr:hypothetical protein CDAR_172561 [Caerostris darwini]